MSTPDEPYICLNERAIGLWSPRGQLRYFQINPFSIFQLNSLYLVIFHLSFIIIKCRQFELSFFLLWVISQFPSVFWRVFWIDSSKLIKCSRRATSLWWAMEIPQSFSKNKRVLCLSSCPSILVENENNWKRPYSGPILAHGCVLSIYRKLPAEWVKLQILWSGGYFPKGLRLLIFIPIN